MGKINRTVTIVVVVVLFLPLICTMVYDSYRSATVIVPTVKIQSFDAVCELHRKMDKLLAQHYREFKGGLSPKDKDVTASVCILAERSVVK